MTLGKIPWLTKALPAAGLLLAFGGPASAQKFVPTPTSLGYCTPCCHPFYGYYPPCWRPWPPGWNCWNCGQVPPLGQVQSTDPTLGPPRKLPDGKGPEPVLPPRRDPELPFTRLNRYLTSLFR